MKYLLMLIATILIVGCGTDEVIPEKEYIIYTSGVVKSSENTVLGVTKEGAPINGGYAIYDITTDEITGFIQMDGSVNDLGGKDLGICEGAVITDTGMVGTCLLPPSFIYVPGVPGDCLDTRDGIFNPAFSPAVCNSHGYFWCSLARQCLNKPINVQECGEMSQR